MIRLTIAVGICGLVILGLPLLVIYVLVWWNKR